MVLKYVKRRLIIRNFYTNVQVYGSKILYRGIEDGRRVSKAVDYHPTLFLSSKEPTEYSTIHGEYMSPVKPGDLRECRDFVKQYEGIENFDVYGNQKYEYAFISDNYRGVIEFDSSLIRVANIDLEVGSENGFPEPATASEPITAITLVLNRKTHVFGCGEFTKIIPGVKYYKCRDEHDLIKQFLDVWSADYPDVVTGWNIRLFDIPYLVNRISNLFGDAMAKRLSPWRVIKPREVDLGNGRKFSTYLIYGVANMDYFDLFQRFAPEGKSQESYKLDAIANVVLGEKKLSYEEYGSLHRLYIENYEKFILYNIRDTELITRMEDKLRLIELSYTLAYNSKSNYEDVFAQVRMWDSIVFNYFRDNKWVIPPMRVSSKSEAYIGAYVKDPIIGLHEYVAGYDLDSLYPHLTMQYNISPETLVDVTEYEDLLKSGLATGSGDAIELMLNEQIDLSILKECGVTMTPNRQFFRLDKQGFIPAILEKFYSDRSKFKKLMIDSKKELEKAQNSGADKVTLEDLEKKISRYNNLQLAMKVTCNSAYGVLGTPYFRFFDIRLAIAITTAGQLSIRWVGDRVNKWMNRLLKNEYEKDYIVASDTDSIYILFKDLVEKALPGEKDVKKIIRFMDKACETQVSTFIDKTFKQLADYVNAYDQRMHMKREALCDKALWTAKKRYILNVHNNEGVEYAKPKIKISGLEMVKSSTPAACRAKLKESIGVIFDSDNDAMIEFIESFREEFKKLPPVEIAFPRGVNGLEKYKDTTGRIFKEKTPINVRGSLIHNEMIDKLKLGKSYAKIKEGEKIKFLYLKEPNPAMSNIIAFTNDIPSEFELSEYIDFDTQFDKSFIEPLKIILDSIQWKTEKVSSLEEFFS